MFELVINTGILPMMDAMILDTTFFNGCANRLKPSECSAFLKPDYIDPCGSVAVHMRKNVPDPFLGVLQSEVASVRPIVLNILSTCID